MTPITRGLPDVITEQTLFDKVVMHLLTQGRPAVTDRGNCRYRTGDDNELSCAGGVLIPDDRYSNRMENRTVNSGEFLSAMPELKPHGGLLQELQWAHDEEALWVRGADDVRLFDKDGLKRRLEEIAAKHALTMPEISVEPAAA